MAEALLQARNVTVSFGPPQARLRAVDNVSLDVRAGETLGIVGESGSGKSTLGLALLGMAPDAEDSRIDGAITFDGRDLLRLSPRELSAVRGRDLSMILQDPMTSLNPVLRVGTQVAETFGADRHSSRRVGERVEDLLRAVGIASPSDRARAFPHMLSGGMKQRVVGAIALSSNPRLLIADEPTTSLDPTVQVAFLDWLKGVQRARGMALVIVTHDFGVVAKMCDRVAVMYAGEIVETAPVRDVFRRPAHWYTRALIDSVPTLAKPTQRLSAIAGAPPRIDARPGGCRFAPRCPKAQPACEKPPTPTALSVDRSVLCRFPIEVGA